MPTSTPTATRWRAAGLLAAALTAATATACTASSNGPATTTSTIVTTSTAPPATTTPISEAPVAPAKPVQEVAAPDNTCPYISNDAARQAEGDRVGRVMLTTTSPPGCNFYWQYDDSRMILQISVQNYPSQVGAYNAMIRDTIAAPERIGVQALIAQDGCTAATTQDDRPEKCVDAILYRTTFYPPDGNTDWAAAFAKSKRVVTVKTQQNDVSFNAKNVAAQIAPRF
ncbi:hypothetical protein ACXR2U_20045 [Jatrophihabitans sp. YIM 134969]